MSNQSDRTCTALDRVAGYSEFLDTLLQTEITIVRSARPATVSAPPSRTAA